MSSYKDLLVWQKCFELTIELYKLTSTFPSSEMYGLVSQMRRAVISILSNIAEGHTRGTTKEFLQFVVIAHSSAAELESQLLVARKLGFGNADQHDRVQKQLGEVSKMLYGIRTSLKRKI